MTANRWQNLFSDAFRKGVCDALEEPAFPETGGHPAADLEFLDRLENGVLSGEEHAAFLHHLATCLFCRHEIAVLIQSGILFPDGESDLNAEPESLENAAETVPAAAAPLVAKRDAHSFSSRISLRVLTAAALFFLFVGAGILFHTENGPLLPIASHRPPGIRGTLGSGGGKESEQERAEHGDAEAQIRLGIRYYKGIVEGKKADPDYVKAVYWFRQVAEREEATEQGETAEQKEIARLRKAEAQNWLGRCYAEGKGVDQNFASAAHWFFLAAEQGNVSAQVRLGKLYAEGLGVDQNIAEAVRWFREAAGKKEHEAEYRLGLCYAEGLGVDQDDAVAADWFKKAANGRNAPAQLQLGLCYAEGRGVEQNDDDAVLWLQRSIDQDSESVKEVLSELEKKKRPLPPEILNRLAWPEFQKL